MSSYKHTYVIIAALAISGCVSTESNRVVAPTQLAQPSVQYKGVRTPVSVGQFDNRSSYMRGIFADANDRLGSQGKTILESHLQQSGYFAVLNRTNMTELKQESGYTGQQQTIKGAKYIITGDVSEFGRKEVGDQQLFGILGRGKSQVAYAKVNINVVDVSTSEILTSVQGAGEYSLSSREVIGFGSTSSYDSTLNGKVLDLAIREAVNNLLLTIQSGQWNLQK